MSYHPNFDDPRIVRAAKRALAWTELWTKPSQARAISKHEINKNFGNTSRPLGRWLKEQLLDTRDSYFNPLTGACKKYSQRAQGVAEVRRLICEPDFVPQIPAEIQTQIESGEFDYTEKSNRLWAPAQRVRRQVRDTALVNAGYHYHYDIEAAAPTLLYQAAQRLDPQLKLVHLEHYVMNRNVVRSEIAHNCRISTEQVKTVINAVLQGSVISRYPYGKLFVALNHDYNAVTRLQTDPITQNLVQDISLLWQTLKSEFPVRYSTDRNGRIRSVRLTSKQKSGYYRALEDQVGKVIRPLLKRGSKRYMWLHDGWRCDRFVDPEMIETAVRQRTGFVIRIDLIVYEQSL